MNNICIFARQVTIINCMQRKLILILSFLLSLFAQMEARIVKIVIDKTESYANGKSFGKVGAFEKLTGRAFGEVDPLDSHNAIIQDILLAPRNAKGQVEYEMDFILLKPVNMALSNGLLYCSVPNRGNAFPADSTLLARGYVYLWGGWQGDLYGEGKVKIKVPVAMENGKEITGLLRTQIIVPEPFNTQNLSAGVFTGVNHRAYETVSLDNTACWMTKRVHALDSAVVIPNSEWAFSDCSKEAYPGTPSATQVSIKGGFDPNYIYDLTYTAKNPLVLGLGFAATRDLVAFFKYSSEDDVHTPNLLGTSIHVAIGSGVSQCGNYLRSFLQLGFNMTEADKPVFEGLNVHIGARRITLNVRFGRPGGGGAQHEDNLFPGNEAPFSWASSYDPLSKTKGGLLDACVQQGFVPKIIHTLSSNEYWQGRMSLKTTTSDGAKDLTIPNSVRIYLFNGTQHGVDNNPSVNKLTGFRSNPNSYLETLRALQIALERWVVEGVEPPKSQYPTIREGTLVKAEKETIGWKDIPNVRYSGLVNELQVRDFGEGFNNKFQTGVMSEPPIVHGDQRYGVLVPKVNEDDNEVGGIQTLTLRAPLGTYTGWGLRTVGYGEGDLSGLLGTFIPFQKTKVERLAIGDPRLSLEERYGSHEGYVRAVKTGADAMVLEGLLLQEDAERELKKAEGSGVLR